MNGTDRRIVYPDLSAMEQAWKDDLRSRTPISGVTLYNLADVQSYFIAEHEDHLVHEVEFVYGATLNVRSRGGCYDGLNASGQEIAPLYDHGIGRMLVCRLPLDAAGCSRLSRAMTAVRGDPTVNLAVIGLDNMLDVRNYRVRPDGRRVVHVIELTYGHAEVVFKDQRFERLSMEGRQGRLVYNQRQKWAAFCNSAAEYLADVPEWTLPRAAQ